MGAMSCCKICFFSTTVFLREGVELFRFFRGDGEPGRGEARGVIKLEFNYWDQSHAEEKHGKSRGKEEREEE